MRAWVDRACLAIGLLGLSLVTGSANAQTSNAGSYKVIVSNAYGSATSTVATVTLTTSSGITLTVSPSSVTNYYSGKIMLTMAGLTNDR